ncbi:hypothetical protein F4677DRAFT_443352 [Hypoxylon crocopeplum]|nr:hypothetical protein F4677DRAFT_443352 [Hypoxylon crocopeplum]
MDLTTPLPFLRRPPRGGLVTHEIILVHGFKTHTNQLTRPAKCREILETWIKLATNPLRDWVNVRTFAIDSAHILHNGQAALSAATIELARCLTVIQQDQQSPLFHLRAEFSHPRNHPSRAVVFIAHGIGTWVVKDFLISLRRSGRRLDPAGLIFLDGPEFLPSLTPVDALTGPVLLRYLQKLSDTFDLGIKLSRPHDLISELRDIDHNFKTLTSICYGPCEELGDSDDSRISYSLKLWFDHIWMSSRPLLTVGNSNVKSFAKGIGSFFSAKSKTDLRVQKLEALKLEESLREAISVVGYHDLRHNLISTTPIGSPGVQRVPSARSVSSMSASGRSHRSDKGKGKETRDISSPRLGRSSSMKPSTLLPILERNEYQMDPPERRQNDNDDDGRFDDKFYDLDDAVKQRDEAVAQDDEAVIRAAQHRLELVLWHQQGFLGKRDPRTLLTLREVVATSLVSGVWNGKPIGRWEAADFLAIERDMRFAYEGLDEALGPVDRATMEALAMVLTIRVSLVERKDIPWSAMVEVVDMLQHRFESPEARAPARVLDTLSLRYRVACTLAHVWSRGGAMLDELLAETEGLVGTVEEEYFDRLSELRVDLKKKIAELREARTLEQEGQEGGFI